MTATVGRPSACELLTALVRVGRLVDEQPATTLGADDVWEEMGRLGEGIAAAQRAGQAVRDAGHHVERACPGDLRRSSRLTLTIDVAHDRDPEEILAVLEHRVEQLLADHDVDVVDSMTRWEPRPLG